MRLKLILKLKFYRLCDRHTDMDTSIVDLWCIIAQMVAIFFFALPILPSTHCCLHLTCYRREWLIVDGTCAGGATPQDKHGRCRAANGLMSFSFSSYCWPSTCAILAIQYIYLQWYAVSSSRLSGMIEALK